MKLEEQKSKVWIMAKDSAAHFIDPVTGICDCGWKPSEWNLLYMEIVDPRAVLFLGHKVCSNCASSAGLVYSSVNDRIPIEKQLLDPKGIKIVSIYKQFIQNLIVVTRLHIDGAIER